MCLNHISIVFIQINSKKNRYKRLLDVVGLSIINVLMKKLKNTNAAKNILKKGLIEPNLIFA